MKVRVGGSIGVDGRGHDAGRERGRMRNDFEKLGGDAKGEIRLLCWSTDRVEMMLEKEEVI
jgi:hypothetical protein